MFCPKCGRPIPEDSNFCVNCGEKLTFKSIFNEETKTCEISLKQEVSEEKNKSQPEPPKEENKNNSDTEIPKIENKEGSNTDKADKLDMKTVLGDNYQYYLKEFEKIDAGEKTKFNMAAFFGGYFFLFYRKTPQIFKKYIMIPLILTICGIAVLSYSFSAFSLDGLLLGMVINIAASVFSLVNWIRLGKNFNKEYKIHCEKMIEAKDMKKCGTSAPNAVAAVAVTVVLLIMVMILPGAVFAPDDPYNFDDMDLGDDLFIDTESETVHTKSATIKTEDYMGIYEIPDIDGIIIISMPEGSIPLQRSFNESGISDVTVYPFGMINSTKPMGADFYSVKLGKESYTKINYSKPADFDFEGYLTLDLLDGNLYVDLDAFLYGKKIQYQGFANKIKDIY